MDLIEKKQVSERKDSTKKLGKGKLTNLLSYESLTSGDHSQFVESVFQQSRPDRVQGFKSVVKAVEHNKQKSEDTVKAGKR